MARSGRFLPATFEPATDEEDTCEGPRAKANVFVRFAPGPVVVFASAGVEPDNAPYGLSVAVELDDEPAVFRSVEVEEELPPLVGPNRRDFSGIRLLEEEDEEDIFR